MAGGPETYRARGTWRRGIALQAVLLALMLLPCTSAATVASEDEEPGPESADWELSRLSEELPGLRIHQLIPTATGALFARTESAWAGGVEQECCYSARLLWRSDDAGTTWHRIPPPGRDPGSRIASYVVGVDPSDDRIVYGASEGALHKSTDGGTTWQRILDYPKDVNTVQAFAVSQVDANVLYVALAGWAGGDFYLLRTRDGGHTWATLHEFHASFCSTRTSLLVPHPADASRVFLVAGCVSGRTVSDMLEQSADQGTTWSNIFRAMFQYPAYLAGGLGSEPSRLYLATNRDSRAGGGSSVFRSDDDGQNWAEVLAYRGELGYAHDPDPDVPLVWVGGLTYDPAQPDHVYVGLIREASSVVLPSGVHELLTSGVLASTDGGETWSDLGRQDLGRISYVALASNGQYLYAASDMGVWRLPIEPVPAEDSSASTVAAEP